MDSSGSIGLTINDHRFLAARLRLVGALEAGTLAEEDYRHLLDRARGRRDQARRRARAHGDTREHAKQVKRLNVRATRYLVTV